ncbi:MAG: hypothetical protein WBA93_29970 [Microcoleaceae cyanobacterium]
MVIDISDRSFGELIARLQMYFRQSDTALRSSKVKSYNYFWF